MGLKRYQTIAAGTCNALFRFRELARWQQLPKHCPIDSRCRNLNSLPASGAVAFLTGFAFRRVYGRPACRTGKANHGLARWKTVPEGCAVALDGKPMAE